MSKVSFPKNNDSEESIIVPINIEALCIGEKDAHLNAQFMPMAINYATLPYRDEQGTVINQKANISEHIVPQPFQGDTFLEKGIHLHWALPDALTRGITGTENIEFPTVPNRWLITRVLSHSDQSPKVKLEVKSWVIESDLISGSNVSEYNTTLIPYIPDNQSSLRQPFAYLGKIFDSESWAEQTTQQNRFSPLTAIGPGEPDFAAFYPKCRGVFGFYDALKEPIFNQGNTLQLTYVIIGWYSDEKEDCLKKQTDLSEALRNNDWMLTTRVDKIGPTLFQGMVQNIKWDPNHVYLEEASPPIPSIAIGNTTTEALAALLAKGDPTKERLLNALQLGILDKIDQPDGIILLEEALHQSYFNSFASGKGWTIEKLNSEETQETTGQIPSVALEKLSALNASQTECEELNQQISSLRWQIFADWYKYMVKEHPQPGDVKDTDLVNTLVDYVQEEITKLEDLVNKKNEKENEAQRYFTEVKLTLNNQYTLKEKASPRFWQPQDPVVLLKGDIVKPPLRYGSDGRYEEDGSLKCRIAGEVVTSLMIEAGAIGESDSYRLESNDLLQSFVKIHFPFRSTFVLLLGEALLLNSQFTPFLAQCIADQGGTKNPAVLNNNQLQQIINSAQSTFCEKGTLEDAKVKFIGTSPSPVTFQIWAQPWLPVILQWKVRYYPVYALDDAKPGKEAYPTTIIKEKFSLEENSFDLKYKGSLSQEFHEYSGEAYLTAGARTNLKNQIDSYFSQDKDNEFLKEIKKEIDGLSILAQSLDGFNASLLMQKKTVQFKVNDPIAPSLSRSNFSNKLVKAAVGNANSLAPESLNSFSPLRAGFLEIIELRLVDTYGRFKDIKDPALVRASHLNPPQEIDKHSNIYLAPRLIQACQLDFKLLPAFNKPDEGGEVLLATPICGWIISNELNKSLMVYDADGMALGSLSVASDGKNLRWQGAPGKDTARKSINESLESSDPYFKNFIFSIYKKDADFFGEFLRTIDRSINFIEPSDFQETTSVVAFFGRPLAVVRSQIGLRFKGLPNFSQSWSYFEHLLSSGQSSERSTGNISGVELPVRIGDIRKLNDGLAGFYIESQDPGYTHFYSSAANDRHSFIIKPDEKTLTLKAARQSNHTLLMIVDPRAQIHALTGILPVKSIQIPSSFYKDAIRNFEVTFFIAPILSNNEAITLPIPIENGLEWTWIQNKEGEWQTSTTIEPSIENANFNFRLQEIYEGWLKLIKPFDRNKEKNEI